MSQVISVLSRSLDSNELYSAAQVSSKLHKILLEKNTAITTAHYQTALVAPESRLFCNSETHERADETSRRKLMLNLTL